MSGIKQQTLKRAIAMLDAIGATYAVIEEDGTKHGTLDVVEGKSRRGSKYPMGTLSSYVKAYIKDMKVGDVVEVPFGEFTGEDVRSAAISWACYHFGNGTLTTATAKDKKVVEALRIS